MYEFEQNKKNNLILYGVTARRPETSENLKNTIANLFRDHLNIRRELGIQKATRILQGEFLVILLNNSINNLSTKNLYTSLWLMG